MLQRIQSIYLLFASLVIFALFVFPLAHNIFVDGKLVNVTVTGVYEIVNGQDKQTHPFLPLTIATVLAAIIPLFLIFLYKNRKQQITISYVAILVMIGYSFWMAQTVKNVVGPITLEYKNMGIGLFLTSLSIVLIIFAIKAIQRDEKLVKSADRLR
ncbi:FtsH-binding integral membrane protein [Mucilaginibacter sp. UYNi724]